jgi:hypothetical protein
MVEMHSGRWWRRKKLRVTPLTGDQETELGARLMMRFRAKQRGARGDPYCLLLTVAQDALLSILYTFVKKTYYIPNIEVLCR